MDHAPKEARMPRRDRAISVTTATSSRFAEIEHRQRNYMITMGIRTGCFLLAAFLTALPVWARLLLLLGSLVLPWVAVTVANAGRVREEASPHLIARPERVAIAPGSGRVVDAEPRATGTAR
jgi:hypothetical protein